MNNNFFGLKFISTIIVFMISSWILIHIFAIFGVILAAAYPAWWIFAPKRTVCFLCRAEREGSKCPFCRQYIIKDQGVFPKNLTSALLNGGLILFFSLISLGIVYGESAVLNKLGIPATPKTASFIIPPKGQYRLGEIFPMKIEIANIENAINAVQADIGFDVDKVEIVNISTTDSFANIFIQKEINNQSGWARLTGGLPNPGFFGNQATFGTIYFKGKSPGLIKIGFLTSSMVLANDGRGTNILKSLPSVSYLITPDKISAEEESLQERLLPEVDVLGVTSTAENQLIFYDEGSVLGSLAEVENATNSGLAEIPNSEESIVKVEMNIFTIGLHILEVIDRFILDFWKRLF